MAQMLCPELVGRVPERDLLRACVADLARHRGGAVCVVAEAGMGKSRLLQHVLELAQAGGALTATGRALADDRSPYRPLAEALAGPARGSGPRADPALEPFRGVLGRVIPGWAAPDAPPVPESTVVLGEGILRALRSAAGSRPVVLVLEDLHWADPETTAVVGYLADHAPEEDLLVVVSARPAEGGANRLLRRLVDRRALAEVRLAAMGDAEVAVMAEQCLGGAAPAGLGALLARAEGVPFLVEELLAAAVEAGVLAREAGTWRMTSDARDLVPRTFAESVADRVAVLPPGDADVLGAAALLGRRIDAALVGGVVDRPAPEVFEALERAAAQQLTTRDAGGYSFRHSLTRDAVGAVLPPGPRAALAARAGAVVEARHPGLPGGWASLAADLMLVAGDDCGAARHLLRAGRRALDEGAAATAAELLERAAGHCAADGALRDDVDQARVETAARAGDTDAAERTGLPLVARLPDATRRARVHLLLAEAACTGTRWSRAREYLARAAAEAADPGLAAEIEAVTATVLLDDGHPQEAERTARHALGAAEAARRPEATCRALAVLGRCRRGYRLEEAEEAFDRMLALAEAHGLPLWRIHATHELGAVDLMRGNDTTRLRRARELAVAAGALTTVATLDLQLAMSAWIAFDAAACIVAARAAQHAARRWRLDLVLGESVLCEAAGLALAGDREPAEAMVARALANGDGTLAPTAWGRRGFLAMLRADHEAAFAAYDRAVAEERRSRASYVRTYWQWWALLATVLDRPGAADARAEVAARYHARPSMAGALIGYAEAVAAGRDGRGDLADALAAEAHAEMASPGLHAQLHLVESVVAPCALADGWGEPATRLRAAAAWFADHDQPDLERWCRSVLHRAGLPLPRRVRGHRTLPPGLAALGVTDREAEVLALLHDGLTSGEIAQRLVISVRTVDKHVERLLAKTGTTRRRDLRRFAT